MNRENRITLAQSTAAISESGHYRAECGVEVHIADAVREAVAGTVLLSPSDFASLQPKRRASSTLIEVTKETTVGALLRLNPQAGSLGCLNFASARNPGGGFLTGAQAQEESLARTSALHRCLLAAPAFYARNRENRSTLYLDLVIFSPRVPFFRDDKGRLLDQPVLASVITAPAPNAGAMAQNERENLHLIEPALKRRAEFVLAVAAAKGIERLVLGAWGCGVFRNDPATVAQAFGDQLLDEGRFRDVFSEVVFAVFDPTKEQETYRAFVRAFAKGRS
ncbi:MAG: Uncharacterized protein FD161_1784 [Limisphaerales bacterium]|nr:MAG: Uncharacterized protein FD161_1784 [Limisphaerales bacterium]TXT47524.1 MAG: Uncharacterized protein FD140_4221 [Limisphaerales bacterium]